MAKKIGRLRDSSGPFEDVVEVLNKAFRNLQEENGKVFLTKDFEDYGFVVTFHWLEWNRKRTQVHVADDEPRGERYVTVESDDPLELEQTYEEIAKQLHLIPITDDDEDGEETLT
ncbi:MAG: hypothetical protein GC204_16460 [Chloroflexi bacterium]|nr:hypothetical protein [Chloroflexota bacterium]